METHEATSDQKMLLSVLRPALIGALTGLMLATSALAASPEQRGKSFARQHCSRCHRPDRPEPAQDRSTLHSRYQVETLGEALAEGIETGHPTMSAFQLDPDQIHDLLSYLKTLE